MGSLWSLFRMAQGKPPPLVLSLSKDALQNQGERGLITLSTTTACGKIAAKEAEMDDPTDIACWQRLDERTTTSGLLRAEDVARLAALGVRHVINLAMDDHPYALPEEARLMDEAGIAYTHIPVPFDAPGEAHFAAFRAAYEAAPGPVHVHCIANWRVSAFFYRYNRDVRGLPEPEARTVMARQWEPETSDNPSAPRWAEFIAITPSVSP